MQSRGDSWRRASLSCPLRPFAIKRDAVGIAHDRNIRRPRVQRIGAGSHTVIVGAIQRTRCLAPRRSALGWTGDPIFAVPGSDARRSGDHLPVLQDGGPPLGLQLFGFADRAAAPFSIAGGVLAVLK
jgi:hypothetical protein